MPSRAARFSLINRASYRAEIASSRSSIPISSEYSKLATAMPRSSSLQIFQGFLVDSRMRFRFGLREQVGVLFGRLVRYQLFHLLRRHPGERVMVVCADLFKPGLEVIENMAVHPAGLPDMSAALSSAPPPPQAAAARDSTDTTAAALGLRSRLKPPPGIGPRCCGRWRGSLAGGLSISAIPWCAPRWPRIPSKINGKPT